MNDLLVALPSRRPHNVARLWEAMGETCEGDTTLLVGVDDDDDVQAYPAGPLYMVMPRMSVVAWINILAVQHAGAFRFVGHIGDDNIPRTPGWDVKLMKAMEKTPFAFGNDLYPHRQPGDLCCHVFCRSEIIGALGYFGPPEFQSMYVDDVWMAWGVSCGITFLEEVILEHMHYTAGKAPLDDIYARSAAYMDSGRWAFTTYCQERLPGDIEKIKAVTACSPGKF